MNKGPGIHHQGQLPAPMIPALNHKGKINEPQPDWWW